MEKYLIAIFISITDCWLVCVESEIYTANLGLSQIGSGVPGYTIHCKSLGGINQWQFAREDDQESKSELWWKTTIFSSFEHFDGKPKMLYHNIFYPNSILHFKSKTVCFIMVFLGIQTAWKKQAIKEKEFIRRCSTEACMSTWVVFLLNKNLTIRMI